MLETFRKFFSSSFGVLITLGVVGLIALAFAAGDVSSSGGFGGVAGGDRAAMVGSERVSTSELEKQAQQGFAVARNDNPRLTMKDYIVGGGFDSALQQLIDRTAITAFGKAHGIVAGKRLIDSELTKIPALQGPDGRFSDAAYRALLTQRQLTDADVRTDIGGALIAKQVLLPADFGAALPKDAVLAYANMLKEHRSGSIAILPSPVFAPKSLPSDAEINAYYTANKAAFLQPERRVIRYAIFDASSLRSVAAPTDAEIAARYNATKAQYAASESRKVTQLIVPAQADAQAIFSAVSAGTSLDAAGKAKGLSAIAIGPLTRDALATQTSPDIAAAVFAAKRGALLGPIRSVLGWTILHVDSVDDKPARSLDDARSEIAAALTAEKRTAALADATARIEDSFDKGGALVDAAKDLGVTPQITPALTADGKIYGQPTQSAPPAIAKIVPTAFSMEREGSPQLAELEAGKTFAMFDVTRITAAAPAPLAQVRSDVIVAIAMQKGADAARVAALKVLAACKKGADLASAIAALGVTLPPVQPMAMGREDLAKFKGQVPPAIGLFFGMAQGTTKLMPAGDNRGWTIIQMKSIVPGSIAAGDPLLTDTGKELASLAGNEYAEELRNAIRTDVGVKRNEVAIRAVSSQLAGNGGN